MALTYLLMLSLSSTLRFLGSWLYSEEPRCFSLAARRLSDGDTELFCQTNAARAR